MYGSGKDQNWQCSMTSDFLTHQNAQWSVLDSSSSSFKLVKFLVDKTMLLTMGCHWNLKGMCIWSMELYLVHRIKGMCIWSMELANRAGFWGIWTSFILKPFICSLEMNNQESFCIWGIFAKQVLSGWVWLWSRVKQSHFLLKRFWVNQESWAPQIVWSLLHCPVLQILTSGR